MARLRQAPFYVRWEPNERCPAYFTDLFEIRDLELIDAEAMNRLRESGSAEIHTSLAWFDAIWRDHASEAFAWKDFAAEVGRRLSALTPVSAVADSIQRWRARRDLRAATGFHIRHTDNLRLYPRWEKEKPPKIFCPEYISQIEGFEMEIEKACAQGRCFLTTDDPGIETRLVSKFGDALMTYPKTYREPDGAVTIRTTSIRDALCDLLLLAECGRIVGTYYSSFSKLGAVWKGAIYYEMRGRTANRNLPVASVQTALGTRQGVLADEAPAFQPFEMFL